MTISTNPKPTIYRNLYENKRHISLYAFLGGIVLRHDKTNLLYSEEPIQNVYSRSSSL